MIEQPPPRIRPQGKDREISPEFAKTTLEPDEIPFLAYWNILVKSKRFIGIIFILVSGLGTYFVGSATTVYTAAAIVKIEPQNPLVTGVGEVQPLDPRSGARESYDYHQTQFALLQSRPLAAKVITELRLDTNKTFLNANIVSPNPVQRLQSWLSRLASFVRPLFKSRSSQNEEADPIQRVEDSTKLVPELKVSPGILDKYLDFLAVSPIRQTRLVRIEFTTPSAALSQALANAHIEGFMRMSLENRFTLTKEARDFLSQKKTELLKTLQKAEAELNAFRRAQGVFSVDKGENIVVERLVDLNKQLTAARAQRLEVESLHRTVANRSFQNLAEIMRQPLVNQLNSNLATLEAEKARLATVFQPAHPRIQELDQQIITARQALKNEIANVVAGINSNFAAAVAKERALQAEAETQQRDALKVRETGAQYTILQEEVNANRALYEGLSKRLNETNVSNDLAVSNMQIMERAARPVGASGPNMPLFFLASLAGGLFLGVGAAFLREIFDSTVETPEHVWRATGLATLGVVPHFTDLLPQTSKKILFWPGLDWLKQARLSMGSGDRGKELSIEHGPQSIIAEAYRAVRTSLLLSQAEKPPRVILVTSPSPGEGKTVTSSNLAIALAHDGHSVLLVDADMRMGCCHSHFELASDKGLSNILTGQLSLAKGLQNTPVSGLRLLSRGTPPPNPSELLGSRKMRDLLSELRGRFDFVLIDSPPVIGISDAAILSSLTDGVLLVLDGQKTSTISAQKAVRSLETVQARCLGVVLNGVNLGNPEFAYYRTYSRYYSDFKGNKDLSAAETAGVINATKRPSKTKETECEIEADSKYPWDDNGICITDEEEPSLKSVADDEAAPKVAHYPSRSSRDRVQSTRSDEGGQELSPEFLQSLTYLFSEAVGPMAPIIIQERIAALGEIEGAFPKTRLSELLEALGDEITVPEVKLQFRKKIALETPKD